jgi:hypothetical protein
MIRKQSPTIRKQYVAVKPCDQETVPNDQKTVPYDQKTVCGSKACRCYCRPRLETVVDGSQVQKNAGCIAGHFGVIKLLDVLPAHGVTVYAKSTTTMVRINVVHSITFTLLPELVHADWH